MANIKSTKYDHTPSKKKFSPMGVLTRKEECFNCLRPISNQDRRCKNCHEINSDYKNLSLTIIQLSR